MNKKRLFYLAISILIYVIIIFLLGPKDIFESLKAISLLNLLLAVLSLFFALLFEFLKWHYFVKKLDINISWTKSFAVFISGSAFALMPAKSGELFRSVLLKREKVPYNKTVPLFFAMNLTLFIVILIIATPVFNLIGDDWLVYAVYILSGLFIVSLMYPKLYLLIVNKLYEKTKIKYLKYLEQSIIYSRQLLGIKELFVSVFLTFIYSFFVFLVFYFIAKNFAMDISVFYAFSIYNLSLILGIATMLPGGIGVTEGSYILLLTMFMDKTSAAVLIILMRFVMFWIPMLIGLIILNFGFGKKDKTFIEN